MSRRRSIVLLATVCIGIAGGQAAGQGIKDRLGLGFNLGAQKLYCDIYHTSFAPGAEGTVKYLLGSKFSVVASLGYGQLTDSFSSATFTTNLINADLKGHLALSSPRHIIPYLVFGLGIFNWQYENWPRYFDGSFIFGGGLEVVLQPRTSLEFYADYRHTTGDGYDGIVRQEKDGYLQVRAGFTYYFKDRLAPAEKPSELIAMDEKDLAKWLEKEEPADTAKFRAFEEKLVLTESAESKVTMEEYLALKSKLDELNRVIAEKEREIEALRTELDFRVDRIAELEDELRKKRVAPAAAPAVTGAFSASYEDALRSYYSRDYNGAIQKFTALLQEYPDHRLASNCQYWIGESYFGLGDYSAARDAFEKVFSYASSYKKDDATLMIGRCYMKLGDNERARSSMEALLRDYPDSEYVPKAESYLRRLRG
ncbi:MAG: tetratricopeptide repeat protein [candidate division KSB1 bacterium]|nr:tetratricopeptide repeat protein [candidate division KSB1 bacterium]MDZ7413135.1 tetratricopeptide repeat protein [candidate division KSB1 bacterium]